MSARLGILTPGINAALDDGELLIRARGGKHETFSVVERVRIFAASDLLPRVVETASFSRGLLDLLLRVDVGSACDVGNAARPRCCERCCCSAACCDGEQD